MTAPAGVAGQELSPSPETPSPGPRPRASTALVVLATLAVLGALWAAQALVLPVLVAMFFALIGNPIIRLFQRMRIPRFLSALFVLMAGIALALVLGKQLVQPAGEWLREAPRQLQGLTPKLQKLAKPVQEANKAAENIARAAGGGETSTRPVQVVRTEEANPYKSLTNTPRIIASVFAVLLLSYFFMVFGNDLQRGAIALLPSRQQKRVTVEILQAIETELSRYVLTISMINAAVGLIFASILYFFLDMPLDEALLWGTMTFFLNYAPYVGPMIGILIMLLIGFTTYDTPLQAVLPAAIYFGLHTVEGQIASPIILGKRMAISPLVLILALMVFGWMWGIIGLLLAVPLLVCVKMVLSRIDGLEGWARLLELSPGSGRPS